MPSSSHDRFSRRQLLMGACSASVAQLACRSKAKPFPGFAVVATKGSTALAVVDLAAFALTGKIVFDSPISQVLYDTRKHVLYAASAEAGTIFEYDWATRRHTRRVKAGESLVEMRLDAVTPGLWVSVSNPASLLHVSLPDWTVRSRIPLPGVPNSFDVASWKTRLVASLAGGGLFLVSDPDAQTVHRIRDGEVFGLVRFRSDGRQLLASNHSGRSLSIIRASDGLPIVDLQVSMEAANFCFKPDGGQLFVTDGRSGGVTIVYPYTTEVDRSVLAGKSPGAMVACGNPPYLLVANRDSSDVTILDLDTGKLVAVVPVGSAPAFLAVTPDNQYALALNYDSGDMAVIRLSAVKSRRNKSAPLFTMVPVGEAPVRLAVIPA